jgi:RNA polymerase sigma-70 factor (sigma-E family)
MIDLPTYEASSRCPSGGSGNENGLSGQNHRAQSCVWGVVERTGDFEAFVAGHGRRLIHLAELLLGDRGAAEDLTQDVLARAYLRWDRVERDDPYAYVRRALINARIDRWRRRLPIPVADLGPDRVVADHAQGVADREHLFAALRLLTPRERGVIALRYYEDLTEAETADVLGVAIGTVKSTTARALAKLRAQPAMRDALARSTR